MKILILEKNRTKEVRKVFEKLEKNKRVKKDIYRTFFLMRLSKEKEKQKKRREMA